MRITPLCLAVTLALTSTVGTALADDFYAEPVEPPKQSKTPALIATAITGALVAATAATYIKFHGAAEHQHTRTITFSDPQWPEKQSADAATIERWRDRSVVMFALTVVSTGVTGYMWSRRESIPTVDIMPMSGGVRVSYARGF